VDGLMVSYNPKSFGHFNSCIYNEDILLSLSLIILYFFVTSYVHFSKFCILLQTNIVYIEISMIVSVVNKLNKD